MLNKKEAKQPNLGDNNFTPKNTHRRIIYIIKSKVVLKTPNSTTSLSSSVLYFYIYNIFYNYLLEGQDYSRQTLWGPDTKTIKIE